MQLLLPDLRVSCSMMHLIDVAQSIQIDSRTVEFNFILLRNLISQFKSLLDCPFHSRQIHKRTK